ncbi:flavin reductase family protein [Nocardioides jensenii]|uniref:flavin reductase family protein n=1 Tax=Nocardioides jensenii TaxID=1843 RepID=UPI00082B8945|nr:flavin reductase [Nocardioides jensenii]
MSESAFEQLMASVDAPLVVMTTAFGNELAGCLVGFHSQSSITPERYCVWLSKANHTYRVALRASHLAVHFLTEHDLGVAEHFGTVSGEDTDKFAGLEFELDASGVPLLAACPNAMTLERISILDDGGDHVCLTTRVLTAEFGGEFTPLRVSDAIQLEPGHASEERAIQP